MSTKTTRYLSLALSLLITFVVVTGIVYADDPHRFKTQKQRFKWIVTKRLTVENAAIFNGLVTLNDELHVDNSQDSVALNVQGHSTQTSDLFNLEDSDSFDRFDVTNEGHTRVAGARDAATGYDYFLTVTGTLDGLASGAKTYGGYIELNRPLGSSVQHGNIDDAGLKIRVDTDAITTTAGYVLNGADIQAKTDNNAMQPTLRGAQITADTDASSYTDYAYGLRVYVEGEGMITTTMQIADFELSRQQATDPTNEFGLNIRNTSRAGGGADVALRIESSYGAGGSAADDNWDYLIDLSPADATLADIRFSQGETVDNLVDGVLRVTGDISVTGALTVQDSSDLRGSIYDSVGDVTIDDGVIIAGNTVINSNLYVTGTSDLRGAVSDEAGDLMLNDNVNVSGDLDVDGNVVVTGTTDLWNTLNVRGAVSDDDSDLMLNDTVNVSGDLHVDGDQYFTGTMVMRGIIDAQQYIHNSTGDLDLRDNVTLTGDLDVSGNLVVTGTSDLRGAVSDGAGDLMVNDNLNISGDVDVGTNLIVTGTSNLQGNVYDNLGDFTIADNVLIDGQANAVQLIVQGNGPGEQSLDLIVAEESGGTDMFSVGSTGNTFISGTLDVRGAVSDGDSDLWISDNVTVTGDVDVSGNLVVTSTSELRGYVYDAIDDLDLRDNVTLTGNLDVSGGLVVTNTSELRGYIYDAIDDIDVRDNITVAGNLDVSGDLVVTSTSDLRGAVSDGAGDLMLNDDVNVSGDLDIDTNLLVTGTSELRGYIYDAIDDIDVRDNITVAGNVDISGNLVVTGTSDLLGYAWDSQGDFTIADNVLIDGQANATQFIVRGNGPGEQALNLLVCEENGGADMFSIGPTGNTFISGTLDVRGAVSDGDSDLWVSDDITVTGDVDISANLTVTGTSDFLGNVFDSQGDLTFADTVTITEDLTVGDTVNYDDRVYHFSGAQSHTPTESMFIGDPTAADLILTLQTGSAEEGDFLYIVNIHATNCITVVDTGATSTGSDQRLDQDDAIGFIYAGAMWVEFTISDNS